MLQEIPVALVQEVLRPAALIQLRLIPRRGDLSRQRQQIVITALNLGHAAKHPLFLAVSEYFNLA
ncbi:hypothetical protein D3C73_1652780 [compost metagenome]